LIILQRQYRPEIQDCEFIDLGEVEEWGLP
jgi:hypothetical protein